MVKIEALLPDKLLNQFLITEMKSPKQEHFMTFHFEKTSYVLMLGPVEIILRLSLSSNGRKEQNLFIRECLASRKYFKD